ncbi:hypothetical protein Caci_6576 [Catenulispora acidiphila DSM 44928]|uniref:Uncharacterized protein n=1 Tax=Catenulispora acidiphila (strain DSM 44928 / JCM 14897 / NBRC 102108 / NRRL B-24433 / ID139908) TaxID=479433 RepID=C7PYD2_CATAD|nr:hypothetical protein [Catenulispora acidiphila]ACU75422.1 hypothetical protein Caci_6576 [Catenulispora acidiphila DSM 44928]
MEIFVRTKSYRQEYGFLGASPDDWWVEYRRLTTVERPGLIARAEGGAWQVLLTGIPTPRTDAADRRITYSVLFEGSGAPRGEDREVLIRVVRAWLDALADPEAVESGIGAGLDEHLAEEKIVRLLAAGAQGDVRPGVTRIPSLVEQPGRPGSGGLVGRSGRPGLSEPPDPPDPLDPPDDPLTDEELAAPAVAVRAVAAQLDPVPPPAAGASSVSVGSVRTAEDRHHLVAAVESLAANRSGFAGYLNIPRKAESAAQAWNHLAKPGRLCVVLADLPHQAVQEAKKLLAVRPDPDPEPDRKRLVRAAGWLLAALVLGVAAVAVWYLLRRR